MIPWNLADLGLEQPKDNGRRYRLVRRGGVVVVVSVRA
jgi:hypothetical protein